MKRPALSWPCRWYLQLSLQCLRFSTRIHLLATMQQWHCVEVFLARHLAILVGIHLPEVRIQHRHPIGFFLVQPAIMVGIGGFEAPIEVSRAIVMLHLLTARSEERRVGKE